LIPMESTTYMVCVVLGRAIDAWRGRVSAEAGATRRRKDGVRLLFAAGSTVLTLGLVRQTIRALDPKRRSML